jgi:hypothetical protein
MSAILGIWNQIVVLATTTDVAMLIVAVLIVVGAGLLIQNIGALVTATIAGLAVFGFANYAQGVALKGENAVAAASTDWQKLTDMHGGMLIAYFISFLVLTAIVFFVRSMLFSR